MKKTIKDLAQAVIDGLEATYDLVYIAQGDRLMDAQVVHIVRGENEELLASLEEFESDARYAATEQIVKDAVAAVIRTWDAEDAGLEDELPGTEEWDSIRYAVEERDRSDWLRELAAATPDVLLRINVIAEDDAYDRVAVDPTEALTKVGLPVTEGNLRIMDETLAECSPEFSILMGYWIVGANVEELYHLDNEVVEVEIVNPHLYLGNPFAGTGFISEEPFEGTVTVKRADLFTDKDAFGYSVTEVYGGLNASQFRATISPVPQPAPTTEDAVLHVRFTDHALSPGLFLLHEVDQIEVTWDEDPVMVAAGRYEIEGNTAILAGILERATTAGVVESYRWAPST